MAATHLTHENEVAECLSCFQVRSRHLSDELYTLPLPQLLFPASFTDLDSQKMTKNEQPGDTVVPIYIVPAQLEFSAGRHDDAPEAEVFFDILFG